MVSLQQQKEKGLYKCQSGIKKSEMNKLYLTMFTVENPSMQQHDTCGEAAGTDVLTMAATCNYFNYLLIKFHGMKK